MENERFSPLPHEWMLVSIIGFFISVFMIHDISLTWGLLFDIVFIIMFISSIVSMSQDSLEPNHLEELAVHKKSVRAGNHRKKKK